MFSDRGTALIVTLVYLIIVTVICISVLGFSAGHYRLMSYRVDRMQNLYYAEGGLYMGLVGARGLIYIQPSDPNTTVNVDINATSADSLESKRNFSLGY